MTRKWDREMILSGILLVLIFIRHTVIGTYADDYKPRWSNGINQHQQSIHQQQQQHQQHSRTAQQAISFSHHHHRHHHDADYMHKNNREMHIKTHFYLDRDYRPATRVTTKTPTTSSWKWSSATAANFRLPELTHIKYQGGNETNDGTMVPVKNRLDVAGERHQQLSANNKRTSIWPYQVKSTNNDDDAPTITFKAEHNLRSSGAGSHYNSNSYQVQQQQDQNSQKSSLEKTSRIDAVDPSTISHEDQGFKSKADYDEDYDESDYYGELDENGNTIEERREDADTEDVVLPEHRSEETNSQKEAIKSEEEAEKSIRDKNDREDEDDDYSSEFLRDDPFSSNDDQNETISLTDRKWDKFGTAAAVSRSRQQYLSSSPQHKVDAHIKRLKEEGKCLWPHPKVIPLIDASNRYKPHCTVLHRCGDDTGCCDEDTKTCVAKKSTLVDLYLYVIPFDNRTKPSIEVRKFENHTECHCVNKNNINRRRRAPRHNNNYAIDLNTPTLNQSCKCPVHFHIVMDGSHCRCDCFTWNQGCYDLKEGNDRFPNEDQKCISENKCQKPTCQYGHYNRHSGRCPKLRTPFSRNNYR